MIVTINGTSGSLGEALDGVSCNSHILQPWEMEAEASSLSCSPSRQAMTNRRGREALGSDLKNSSTDWACLGGHSNRSWGALDFRMRIQPGKLTGTCFVIRTSKLGLQ